MHCELKFTTESTEELARVAAAVAGATGRDVEAETAADGVERVSAPAEQAPMAVGPHFRERLGMVVRDVWVTWAREQPTPKLSWLAPWAELSEPDREVDRRIGEQLFQMGRAAGNAEARPAGEGAVEVEALRKRIAELEVEHASLKAQSQAAREELGARGFEPLGAAARRVADALTQELGGEARRRAVAEAREQGAAEMRERAAMEIGFYDPMGGDRIRALPLDGAPSKPVACAAVLDTNKAVACTGGHAPDEAHRNGGLCWGEDAAAYPTQTADVATPAAPGLSAEDAETLRVARWRKDGELWRGPDGGFYDPRTPFGLRGMREAAEALREKAPVETTEPTARDAVAGMLLRHDYPRSADMLARRRWAPADLATEMRHPNPDASRLACIAALGALARGELRGARNHQDLLSAIEQLTRERDEAGAEAATLREQAVSRGGVHELSTLRREHQTDRDDEPADRVQRWGARRDRIGVELQRHDLTAFARGYLNGCRDTWGSADVEMVRADVKRAISGSTSHPEEPSGMRIERRADGEYLIGSGYDLNACCEKGDGWLCHYHMNGEHIATDPNGDVDDGAEKIAARWPIAPRVEEPPTDPGKPPTGEPVPADDRAEPAVSALDHALANVPESKGDISPRGLHVLAAAFNRHGGALLQASRGPHMSGQAMAWIDAACALVRHVAGDTFNPMAPDATGVVPPSGTTDLATSAVECAHADGIVEGLRRAREAARRLSDGDRLGAVDVAAMIEAIDACSAGLAHGVAAADVTPPVAPDMEALGREVHEVWAREWAADGIAPAPKRWGELVDRDREVSMRIGERLFNMGVRHAHSHAIPRLIPISSAAAGRLAERIGDAFVDAMSEPGDGELRAMGHAMRVLRLVDEHLHGGAKAEATPPSAPADDERWRPGAVWEHRAYVVRRLELRQVDEVRGLAFLHVQGTWSAMQSVPCAKMTAEQGWRYVGRSEPGQGGGAAPRENSMTPADVPLPADTRAAPDAGGGL